MLARLASCGAPLPGWILRHREGGFCPVPARFLLAAALLACAGALIPASARAASVTVDSADDYTLPDTRFGDTSTIANLLLNQGTDNRITLREAIEAANNTPNGAQPDSIAFQIPGGDHSIDVLSGGLPSLSRAVIIDGTTDVDYLGTPIIELNGSSAGGVAGLTLADGSAGSTIRGLVINRFGGPGILLQSDNNLIESCYLGTNVAGTIDRGNSSHGVDVANTSGNRIGRPGSGNLISGNNLEGVIFWGSGATGNFAQGNLIGTNANGDGGIPNTNDGVHIGGGAGRNTVGGFNASEGNVISGNGNDGVEIDGRANVVFGNYIGTDDTGMFAVANGRHGVVLYDQVDSTRVGGSTPGHRNVISGNSAFGVILDGNGGALAKDNFVAGNYIGTDKDGLGRVANVSGGVRLFGGAADNTIGGPTPNERNLISGNNGPGVYVTGLGTDGNKIQSNFIGADVSGTATLHNWSNNVDINQGASGTIVGGVGSGNVIAFSGNDGITIWSSSTTGTVVQGNFIGTDLSATLDLGNTNVGVVLSGGTSGNRIGGLLAGEGNTIAWNESNGVEISDSGVVDNALLGNRIFANDDMGIDIDDNGVTNNDSEDEDGGPNRRQNYPVLTSATTSGVNSVTVNGTLNSQENETYRLEFFSSATGDPTDHGEAEQYLGGINVTTSGYDATFGATFAKPVPVGDVITATATVESTPLNFTDTSEFAQNVTTTFSPAHTISGGVFEDVDFRGTASGWDGGVVDQRLEGVDVELYDSNDLLLGSVVTGAGGAFSFGGLANGVYKVRARSETIGDADTEPAGGLHTSVPGTWPYPVAEMTWGNDAPLYGGQDPTVDDRDTGDDLGPGDTYVLVTVSGGDVTGVDLGFAFNLIVHTGDDGAPDDARSQQGSLRQFLKNANAIGRLAVTGADSSQFRMGVPTNQSFGGEDWWRTVPLIALPTISDAATALDASTQGQNGGETNSKGPEIEIFANGLATHGIDISANDNLVRGLIVNGFNADFQAGIRINGAGATGNVVAGNYVGTNAVASGPISNYYGVFVTGGAKNNLIGGSGAADGNVLSGNSEEGLVIASSGTDLNQVRGNYIGLGANGLADVGNGDDGIEIRHNARFNQIGGPDLEHRNFIAGNSFQGVTLNNAHDNTIENNYIGTNVAGDTSVPNLRGVWVSAGSSNNTVGGVGLGNLISGNLFRGIVVGNAGTADNIIQGNTIGLDSAGNPLGNVGAGVEIQFSATGTAVGGALAGEGNVIAYNTGDGVFISTSDTDGHLVQGNSIYDNAGLALDLGPDGVGTGDGANDDKAPPVITSVVPSGADFIITLTAGTGDVVDLYRVGDGASIVADPSGYGEGHLYLGNCKDNGPASGPHVEVGSDTKAANGEIELKILGSGVTAASLVSATATDNSNNTSEFSLNSQLAVASDLAVVKTVDDGTPDESQTITYTITVTNDGPDAASGIELTDVLPAGVTFVSDTPSQGSYDDGAGVWTVGGLANGANATLDIVASVDAGTAGTTIGNTASVTALDQPDPASGNDSDNADITVTAVDLQLSKVVDDGTPDEGQTITYTITLTNNGPDAGTGIEVTDNLPAGVSFVSDTPSQGSYVAGTGVWTVGGLANGASATLDVVATVNGGTAGSTINSAAAVTTLDQADPVASNDGDAVNITVSAVDLQVAKVVDDGTPDEGQTITYTVTVTNGGPDDGTGIVLSDVLPAGLTFVSDTPSQGSYDDGTGVWNVGGLTNGVAATLDLVATVDAGAAGSTITNVAFVSGLDQADPVAANNAAQVPIDVNTVPTWSISGTVFEDVDFTGSASEWDGGVADAALSQVDVELYDSVDSYIQSTPTAVDGSFSFDVPDGVYKIRVRSGTIGDANTEPAATFHTPCSTSDPTSGFACALAEAVWAHGGPFYGGQSPLSDDSAVADDAGPGDTWVAVTVSGGDVNQVNFGFAYNVVVNTLDVGQGSLRQFLNNANALGNGLSPETRTSYFRIPNSDPGFDVATGVFTLTPATSLPTLSDAGTIVDGTTQMALIGDSNAAILGTGGVVGTDSLALAQVAGPEIEIVGGGTIAHGLRIQGDGVTIRGLALHGFRATGQDGASVQIDSGATGVLIESNVIGGAAVDFGDPLAGLRSKNGVVIDGAQATVQGNLIGRTHYWPVLLKNGADATQILGNEVHGVTVASWTVGFNSANADGVGSDGSIDVVVRGNLIAGSSAYGIAALSTGIYENNTVRDAGVSDAFVADAQSAAVAVGVDGVIVRSNVVQNNAGPGVLVWDGFSRARISRNAFGLNGGIAIDLVASGAGPLARNYGDSVTTNSGLPPDCGYDAGGANLGIDTPVIDWAADTGGTVRIAGRACADATIEIYRAVADADGSDGGHGEGVQFVGSTVADASGSFLLDVAAGLVLGDEVSATATDVNDNTSEFALNVAVVAASSDLSVAKFVDTAAPAEGDTVTYDVVVTNLGPQDATGIVVRDSLVAELGLVSSSATQGGYDGSATWSVGNLSVGAQATLTLFARVAPGSAGSNVDNVASIQALDQTDPVAGNDSANVAIMPTSSAALLLTIVDVVPQLLLPGDAAVELMRARVDNPSSQVETIESITFANAATGPGTPAQLDANWSSVELVVEDSQGGSLATGNGTFSGQTLVFPGLSAGVAARDSVFISLRAGASLAARDGDRLAASLSAPASLQFSRPVAVAASWPVSSPDHTINGMAAAQITRRPVAAVPLAPGSVRTPVLDFELRANGYEPDRLDRLNVSNLGTAQAVADVEALEAWVDDGDGVFDPVSDSLLGPLVFTGDRWEITGVQLDITTSARLFVTASIAGDAIVGRTLQLSLPTGIDVAIGMVSDNDGPVDVAVANGIAQTIAPPDRVTLSATSFAGASVAPGETDVVLLEWMAANTYPAARTLTAVAFSNASSGAGTLDQLDNQLGSLILRLDGDGDGLLGDVSVDPVLGSTSFDAGRGLLSGLAVSIGAGETVRFFLTADVSLNAARDGDLLAARVDGEFDLQFAEPTSAVAAWPVDGVGRWAVDGQVARQIDNHEAPPATLGAGEGPALVLDLTIPANGYADDVLNGLRLTNLGTATTADIADLRLWRDDGDGAFAPASDVDLGPLVPSGPFWDSVLLGESLTASAGARLFVGMSAAVSIADSSTVRLAVPLGGIQMASNNDGPVDQIVANASPLLLSPATLLTSLEVLPAAATLGASVGVRMRVRNVGSERIDGIVPSALVTTGGGGVVVSTGPAPSSLDLDPGQSGNFDWTYDAVALGNVRWTGNAEGVGATSSLSRSSLATTSGELAILASATEASVFASGTMPTFANRGQAGLAAFSLTFRHRGVTGASDIHLQRLRIDLSDGEGGQPLVPADVLTRFVVREGSTFYADQTSLPATGNQIDLVLSPPVRVSTQEPATVTLEFDVAASATASGLAMAIVDGGIEAVDALSTAPADVVVESGSYPLTSGTAQLRQPATLLEVRASASTAVRTVAGATDVGAMQLDLRNLGTAGSTADVSVAAFAVVLTDTSGVELAQPADQIESLHLYSGSTLLASYTLTLGDSGPMLLEFSPVLRVPAGPAALYDLRIDVTPTAMVGALQARLAPVSHFETWDTNSAAPVTVQAIDAPVAGSVISIEQPAGQILAGSARLIPSTVTLATADVPMLSLSLIHPGGSGTGGVALDDVTLTVLDRSGVVLAPGDFLAEARLLVGGSVVSTLPDLATAPGPFAFAPSGLRLGPAQSMDLEIRGDVAATASLVDLEVRVVSGGIALSDEITGDPVGLTLMPGTELPLTSGITRLVEPARALVISLENRMPTVLAADGLPITAAVLALTNPAPQGSDSIEVRSLELMASDREFIAIPVGSVAAQVALYDDNTLWAAATDLGQAQQVGSLVPAAPLRVAPGERVEFEVRVIPSLTPTQPSWRLGLAHDGVAVEQPAGSLLQIEVEADAGSAFPLWTTAGGFTALSLSESFVNYPNPFAAGREETIFSYYLREAAAVTLKLWSPRGEHVVTLLHDEPRAAGLHQIDVWGGLNGRGKVVLSEVFLAELQVDYATGPTERLVRKVAVVR